MAEEFPYFRRVQVNKYMMALVYRMCICVRIAPSSLKIFTAHKTAVDVDVAQRDGAKLFKIEIQAVAIDLGKPPQLSDHQSAGNV